MTHAIRFHHTGGPEVLQWEEVELAPPAPGEVTLRQEAVGLNFIDTYHRSGLYPVPLPTGIGLEAAGVVEALGAGVTELRVGDRVAYAGGAIGAYAERRNIVADRLVPLPAGISSQQGAAMMLQGLTAQYLLRRTVRIEAGDTLLIHAAAGGVGQIVCQWAKALGAQVIGTVGSEEKAAFAHARGCDHPIIYTRENFVERVREITGGAGVRVVYDSIGRDTFQDSLSCLAPLGTLVLFGSASGPVEPFDPQILAQKGSLFLTRPTLFTYTAKRADLLAMSAELFEQVSSGKIQVEIGQRHALKDAAQAQRELEARRTVGATVLLP